jgi:hypothetical protein
MVVGRQGLVRTAEQGPFRRCSAAMRLDAAPREDGRRSRERILNMCQLCGLRVTRPDETPCCTSLSRTVAGPHKFVVTAIQPCLRTSPHALERLRRPACQRGRRRCVVSQHLAVSEAIERHARAHDVALHLGGRQCGRTRIPAGREMRTRGPVLSVSYPCGGELLQKCMATSLAVRKCRLCPPCPDPLRRVSSRSTPPGQWRHGAAVAAPHFKALSSLPRCSGRINRASPGICCG